MMKDYSNLEKLLLRYIKGDCSADEIRNVERWIQEDPDVEDEYESLKEAWEISGEFGFNSNKPKSWENISQRITEHEEAETPIYELNFSGGSGSRKKKSRSPHWLYQYRWHIGAVAALLVMGIVSYFVFPSQINYLLNGPNPVMREIATQPGEQVNVTFSDGTNVRLNAASIIRLPEEFAGKVREVELVKGEAYFEVTSMPDRPFLVHTPRADVEVLGTKFNINAYPNNKKIQVIVAEGKVAVRSPENQNAESPGNSEQEVLLTRGEVTEVDEYGMPSQPKNINIDSHLGWIDGVMIFDNSPLDQVLTKLSNYYGVTFEISDSTLQERKLTAKFHDESLARVLEIAMYSLDIKYTQNGEKIILKPEMEK
ncbi:FecR domain-containing protein [Aliifodinibius sp. S!AR15-10]|uniref:FecR domain-containing protein n=1 Tax=Aliifodinibius sp. S!AR15-10 TaxID=2950437 RepID=UPI00285B84A3|nr:FecR domain-containing protein [Aliifodinibius sp. S!AR15-10]MDR8393575.1 FecR domain-containing protein [Aliifodinibius sp. S!AR15-10]